MTLPRNAFLTLLLSAVFAAVPWGNAQPPLVPAISGVVTDPSGALIPHASVILHPTKSGSNIAASTDDVGHYALTGQPRTQYRLIVTAPGFATFVSNPLQISPGKPRTLDVRLKIADPALQVNVTEDDATMTVDPSRNGDSITLSGAALDTLPLNPTELLQQLQALSGGPSPDLYVDGFSDAKIPPRDTIREIRINQNPYSAQYDTAPGTGRIEMLTKPGTNQLHGDYYLYFNNQSLNSTNPLAGPQPPYYALASNGDLSGPLGKHASFYLNGGQDREQINAFIDAQTLDAANNQTYLVQAVPAPTNTYNLSSRLDFAIGGKSTLIARYLLTQTDQTNAGVGQLALADQGYDNHNTNQILQLSNSRIVTSNILNDTRFQYTRSRVSQNPYSTKPTISVEGAFTGGGNNGGSYHDNQDRFEFQNYVSTVAGKHFVNFGGRLRSTRDANESTANYNGTYTFASLALYQSTLEGMGGAPSQFSITQGNPSVAVTVADLGLFVQDDWKARPNLTLSGGLRFESQNHIADHADWAPRLGIAWSPNRKPIGNAKPKPGNYTLRGGFGIFYRRFGSGYVLQAERQNGIAQQQYIVPDPPFFYPNSTPTQTQIASGQAQSSIYQIGPAFHAPYYLSATAAIERRIGNRATIAATWLGIRGDRTQYTRNANAPLPGTYNPNVPSSGTRPLGGTENVFEYDSGGVLRTNRFTTSYSLRFGPKLFLYGIYQLQSTRTDANENFVSNSYDVGADYGPANNDIRHQASIASTSALPWQLRLGTFTQIRSGTPFNITVGQDLNGDSIFNDRPAFATDMTRSSVVSTAYGTFDTSPIAGQAIVPINYGRGLNFFTVNTSLTRTIAFGPRLKPPATRKFSLDLGFDVQNLFNHVNLAPPVGTLNSPLFGKSISLATGNGATNANRIFQMDAYFHF